MNYFSDIVVNWLARGSHPSHATILVLLGSNLGQVVYSHHIASPVFSAPRNCGTKESFR